VIRKLLIEDLAKPTAQRSFSRTLAPDDISEADIREFGAFVLNVCNQVPLRSQLTTILERLDRPRRSRFSARHNRHRYRSAG
jgi:hypothetical protein